MSYLGHQNHTPDLQKSQFKFSVMCILSVSLQTLSCTFGKDMAGYIKQDVRHPVLLPLQYTAVPRYVLTAMQHQHNCLLIVSAREAPSRMWDLYTRTGFGG